MWGSPAASQLVDGALVLMARTVGHIKSGKVSAFLLVSVCIAGLAGCRTGPNLQLAQKHFARGQVLVFQGDLEAALKELAKAIEADPELSIAYTAIGDVHRRWEAHELAARAYETACEKNPYAFRAHYNLGFTYQVLADAAKMTEIAQQYLRRAAEIYRRTILLRPDDFETNLNISVCYYELGRDDLAEQYCVRAIELDPRSPQAYSNLGIIYDRQGRAYQAIRSYKASLELEAKQPNVLMNLGIAYVKQDRLAAAISAFEMAGRVSPDNPTPWEKLGACHYRKRNFPEALDAYEKALSLDPGGSAAHRGIGVVYITQFILEPHKTELREMGLAAWNSSLETEPDQPNLIHLLKKYTPFVASPNL